MNKKKLQDLLQGHKLKSVDDNSIRPNNSLQMQVNWISIKKEIMRHPI
jgi:hypothetical protein